MTLTIAAACVLDPLTSQETLVVSPSCTTGQDSRFEFLFFLLLRASPVKEDVRWRDVVSAASRPKSDSMMGRLAEIVVKRRKVNQ